MLTTLATDVQIHIRISILRELKSQRRTYISVTSETAFHPILLSSSTFNIVMWYQHFYWLIMHERKMVDNHVFCLSLHQEKVSFPRLINPSWWKLNTCHNPIWNDIHHSYVFFRVVTRISIFDCHHYCPNGYEQIISPVDLTNRHSAHTMEAKSDR